MNIRRLLLPSLFVLSGIASADTTLKYVSDGKPAQDIAVSGDMVRLGMPNVDVLFDSSARVMTMIDHRNKSYTRMDEATMQQMAEVASTAMKNMASMMDKLPPEQRARLEAMMPGGKMKMPSVSLVDTGKSDKVNGHRCEIWNSQVEGQGKTELCVAPIGEFDIASGDLDTLKALFEFSSRMASKFGPMASAADEWKQLGQQIPVRIVEQTGDKLSHKELSAVSTARIPSSQFQVPAGYTERKMPMMGAMHGAGG